MEEEEKKIAQIPYFVYEGEQVRNERVIRRLLIALLVVIILLFATNIIWIYEWSSYDYGYNQEYSQDGTGTNIIGTGNEVDE